MFLQQPNFSPLCFFFFSLQPFLYFPGILNSLFLLSQYSDFNFFVCNSLFLLFGGLNLVSTVSDLCSVFASVHWDICIHWFLKGEIIPCASYLVVDSSVREYRILASSFHSPPCAFPFSSVLF